MVHFRLERFVSELCRTKRKWSALQSNCSCDGPAARSRMVYVSACFLASSCKWCDCVTPSQAMDKRKNSCLVLYIAIVSPYVPEYLCTTDIFKWLTTKTASTTRSVPVVRTYTIMYPWATQFATCIFFPSYLVGPAQLNRENISICEKPAPPLLLSVISHMLNNSAFKEFIW